MRWGRVSLCALVTSTALLVATVPADAAVHHAAVSPAIAPAPTVAPTLALASQTPWVTPTAPWFSLALGVGPNTGPVGALSVQVTFYRRMVTQTDFIRSLTAVPSGGVLTHLTAPVSITPGGRLATTCVTVLPNEDVGAPASTPGAGGACPAGAPTVVLNCTPQNGSCGDVYPVSVALYRQGTASPLGRFTTFLSYEEPGIQSDTGGSLRVSLVVPLATRTSPALTAPNATDRSTAESVVGSLWAYRGLPVTLAASPTTVSALAERGGKAGQRAVARLAALASPVDGDQLLSQPFVPIDVAALAGVGLTADIGAQMTQGGDVLRQAGLRPATGTWVDTDTVFSTANAPGLAGALPLVHAHNLVLSDANLAPAGLQNLTFAQPFTLSLGHGAHVTAAAANTQADALFTADPHNPLLAANQLLATLEFTHFQNAYSLDPRGVVLVAPEFWRPANGFLATLLAGIKGNPALAPVTLDQFFAQVPKGGNEEPARRHFSSAAPAKTGALTAALAQRLTTARSHLASFTAAVQGHHPVLGTLSNLYLTTESRALDRAQCAAALAVFIRRFGNEVNLITLAAQRTVTFTSRTAPIPVSILSAAPFPVTVVVSLASDKFTFPDGRSRTLLLQRPTTPLRLQARSRTSGDHLPVVITLTTPDGGLVIARTDLTVRSTSISVVGIGLTVLAALVLLVWWVRTWRKGRPRRPRVTI